MPRGVPFVITRAEGTKGFPAMLRGLMWRANFSYAREYFVYTTQIGPNVVLCYARLMTSPPERSHIFSGTGSSPDAIVQASAYSAFTSLRHRYSELNCSYTFAYFPYQVSSSVNEVLYPHPMYEDDTQSYRMSELIRALVFHIGALPWS